MNNSKFSIEQIIKNTVYDLFCFEIKSQSQYSKLRQEAIKANSELVKRWDRSYGKCGFPIYLNKIGQAMSKSYALQHGYTIITFDDIKFNSSANINTAIDTRGKTLDDLPYVAMKEFKEQNQEYKELVSPTVTNILEYINKCKS